jgi:hypothetical protein
VLALLASCAFLLGASATPALATRSLTTGLTESAPLVSGAAGTSAATWSADASTDGVSMVRIAVGWSGVAPAARAPGFNASNPSSPGYDWASVDPQVKTLTSEGFTVLITINSAPSWAEDGAPGRFANPGSWRPDPTQFAEFATAIATRYDGRFRDPGSPLRTLPRVRYWQAWNEPNLAYYLDPQWVKVRGRLQPASPTLFRGLENAFYRAVKRVSQRNFVVMGGTAPYGDLPGGARMRPLTFYRYLFCERNNAALSKAPCPGPTYFDAVDHHPYAIGGPLQKAFNANDLAVPDVYRVVRVVDAAEREGRALPRAHKQLWIGEISWDTDPPDPQAVPIEREARWLEQSMYVLWRQGASVFLWLQVVDGPPIPDYASTYQAGLYFLSGDAKPAARAYRFPFVTQRTAPGRITAWGRAPLAGVLEIERQSGTGWQALRRLTVRRGQVFETSLRLTGRAVLRAEIGRTVSLTWTQSGR